MRLLPAYTVKAVTGGFAPKPSGIRQDQIIGTGRAYGVGGVGGPTEGNEGDGAEMTAAEMQAQQAYFDSTPFAGVYSPDKDYPETLTGYLEKALDYALAPHVEFNSLTQSYRATSPGGIIEAAMGPLAAFMAAGSALSKANLENINEQTLAGKPGYGIGLYNDAILGVSPNAISTSVFGMSPTAAGVLSGTIPETPPGFTQEEFHSAIMDALRGATRERSAFPPGIGPPTAIPNVTEAVNMAMYGDVTGADQGSNFSGVVTSYDQDTGFKSAVSNVTTVNIAGKPVSYNTPVVSNPPPGFIMGLPSPSTGGQPGGGAFGYGPDPQSDPGFDSGVSGQGSAPAGFDAGAVSAGGVPDSAYGPDPAANPSEGQGDNPGGGTGNTGSDDTGGATAGSPGSGGSDPDADGDGNGSGKIVCTAINLTYGLPMYTNKVWLAYNRKHNLDGAWELGYHKLFYPLVKRMNTNRLIHNFLIWFAKTRTHGVKEHMKGNKFTVRTLFLKPVLGSIVYLTGKAIQAGLLKKVDVDVRSLINKDISKHDR